MTTISDPDFAQEVVDGLYRYRHKRIHIARILLLFTGIFGGHRFYLGKVLSGVVYLLSFGGGLVLWLWDFTQIRRLVNEYNQIEDDHQQAGRPPQSLAFLPPIHKLDLSAPPTWRDRRNSRSVLIGGTLLLAVIGLAMGAIAGSAGILEPSIIMIVFMVVTLVAARWPSMRKIPILSELSSWNHRLRLYYFTTDPGSVWALAMRPLAGVFVAPWRQRSRAEVRLYLQIGIVFGVVFAAFDLYEIREHGFWKGLALTFAELVQTIAHTYAFVAPAGAILLTQQLLARQDSTILLMCLVTLSCGYLGLSMVGAV